MSHVTCHLSPVTCHLTITLCSFNCYKGPRSVGDAAVGGLVWFGNLFFHWYWLKSDFCQRKLPFIKNGSIELLKWLKYLISQCDMFENVMVTKKKILIGNKKKQCPNLSRDIFGMASLTQIVIHLLQFQFPSQLEAESTYMAAASGHSTKLL